VDNGCFASKIAICLKKVCYKVSPCENCQWQTCKAFIALTIHAKMIAAGHPLLRENLADSDPPPYKNADFQSVFAVSGSAVTPSKKSSINITRKSTVRFPMSLRWIVYVDPKPPKGGSKTQCPKFKQQSAITSKRYEIGCQLLLITNRKSHTDFRLVPTLVTLNDLERHNSPYFALFHRRSQNS